ncbi:MAG: response regulator [Spirochaetaceae bacterium]|nr:response regulator [Spirochaetaceae bacterium]
MRKKIRDNVGFIVYTLGALLVLGAAVYMSNLTMYISAYLVDTIRARLVTASRTAAEFISGAELDEYMEPEDMEKPGYQELKTRLVHFAETYELEYVYYYRILPGGNTLQAIADNDLTEDSYNLTTKILEVEDDVRRAIVERAPVATQLGGYSIGWTGYLTSFAPIFDEDGNVTHIAGVDVSDEKLLSTRARSLVLAALLLVAILILLVSGFLLFFHYRNRERNLSRRFAQQQLMSRLARSFISARDTESLINDALRITGQFLNATRIVIGIAERDSARSRAAYIWSSSGSIVTEPTKEGLNDIINSFPVEEPPGGVVPMIYCNDVTRDERFSVMQTVGVRSFMMAPLYVDGMFWAVLAIEEHSSAREWTESDRQLVTTVSSVIAGAAIRDMREKERDAALAQAEQASKAKSDFLANMSHEMRTPMNAIIGMTAIAKSSRELEKKEYCLDKIEDASTHLLGVINDILDMSKIEANKFELSFADFNFEKMLRKVVNVINFRVEEKRQIFSVHIDRRIPRNLFGDDQRLAQVITNLLSNAVKFTPEEGTITLDARFVEDASGNSADDAGNGDAGNGDAAAGDIALRVSVSDTGIGLSTEQQGRLFASFEQADSSTSRKFGGTGLGLAISKRIVEMMNGRIWVESELGKGAAFVFTAVLRQAENDTGTESMFSPGVNWSNLRMLAVDDAAEIRDYFTDIAGEFGFACDTAGGGGEALELIRQKGPYDIDFVDWKMPGMNGIELSRMIRENHAVPETPDGSPVKSVVIMISAAEWNTIEDEARAAGVDKFLSKPLFPSAIADVINECLGMAAAQPQAGAERKTPDFTGRWILLAEDVEINREILISLLEPTHVGIDCAENGLEAVRLFTENPGKYGVIFMDVQMPELDGYGATRKIRELEAASSAAAPVPIIAMTANVFREDIEKCLEAGMDGHVGKPLDMEDVMAKLREYLPAALTATF